MSSQAFFVFETFLKAVVILAVIAALAGFATYLERKILAFMQRRLGPMMVGPFGILQVVADMIKLFTKEDIIPANAIKPIFLISPLIATTSAFTALSCIPFLPPFTIFGHTIKPILCDVGIGVLFVMSVASVSFYAPLLGGLSSANKWGLLGASRAIVLLLSFEVVSGIALLAPVMMIGSLSLVDINNFQGSGILSWVIFKQPLAFGLFLLAGFAETNRTPFNLTENETEIVSGYGTEYSGMRWGLFFIGEYTNMITISFLVSLIFLGGYNSIWFIPGGIVIFIKTSFLIFLFLWTRAAWPHLRPDQLMWLCWKVLMPLALVNVFITGLVLI